MNPPGPAEPFAEDAAILAAATHIAQGAGKRLLDVFSSADRPRSRTSMLAALTRNDEITAMLASALLVRASVPCTFPMLLVAAGQNDAFWLYESVLAGVAAGVLLVTEAGGVASRVDGAAWALGSPDLLVCAPGVHAACVEVLRTV
jgi:fructose-1,6-bisphosphatase/inositol monophosphatase family enzyme